MSQTKKNIQHRDTCVGPKKTKHSSCHSCPKNTRKPCLRILNFGIILFFLIIFLNLDEITFNRFFLASLIISLSHDYRRLYGKKEWNDVPIYSFRVNVSHLY